MASEHTETGKYKYPLLVGNTFSFKFEDQNGHIHRFNCGQYETRSQELFSVCRTSIDFYTTKYLRLKVVFVFL